MSKHIQNCHKDIGRRAFLAMVVTSLSITGTTADAKQKIKSVKVKSPVVNGGKLVLKKGQKKQIKVKVTKSGKISKRLHTNQVIQKLLRLLNLKEKFMSRQ